MAKEIFTVPASTVAVEHAFSVGGCVLDDKRNNLSAKNMEATMLLDDWAKANMRTQEPDFNFRVENDGEDFTTDEEVGSEIAQQYHDWEAAMSTADQEGKRGKRTMRALIPQ